MQNNDRYTETYTENWLFKKKNEEVTSPATRYKLPEDPGAWFNFGPLAEELLKLYLGEIMHLKENTSCVCDLEGLFLVVDNHDKLLNLFAILNDYRFDEHIGTGRLIELAKDVYYEKWVESEEYQAIQRKRLDKILNARKTAVKETVKVQEVEIHE